MRLKSRLQRFVRARLMRMDIDATANIEASAMIDRTWPRGIHIGPRVYIGHEAVILTHDMTRGIYMDTRIGARSHVGARAIVFPGVTVGADCVIHPGAVVNRDVPDGCVAIGNPARIEPGSAQVPGSLA